MDQSRLYLREKEMETPFLESIDKSVKIFVTCFRGDKKKKMEQLMKILKKEETEALYTDGNDLVRRKNCLCYKERHFWDNNIK